MKRQPEKKDEFLIADDNPVDRIENEFSNRHGDGHEMTEMKPDDLQFWEQRANDANFLFVENDVENDVENGSSDHSAEFEPILEAEFVLGDEPPCDQIENFILTRKIGRGGGGVVYEGRQLAPTERRVAIKLLFRNGPDFESRWETEPRVLAALNHPNIVSIIDSGLLPDQTPWIAMRFVEGIRADEWVRARFCSPIEIAILMREVALGIAYAHKQKILHRDLKPSNILVSDTGVPVITDFGLARLEASADASGLGELYTTVGLMQGSLGYLAPEQANPNANSKLPGVDVWGLAATLYRLLTGTTPVRNDNWFIFVEDLARPDRIPVRKLNPRVPRDLESVCMKGLQFEPGDRYQTATEFAEELQRVILSQPVRARQISRLRRAVRWAKREPVVASLLGVMMIGLLVSSIVFGSLLRTTQTSLKRAQETLDKSLANIYEEHKLASALLPNSPGSVSYRIARLESTIRLNQELAAMYPGDRAINYRLHVNQFQLAELLPNKGRLDEAQAMCLAALQGFEAFAKSDPENPEYQFDVFHANFMLGNFVGRTTREKRPFFLKSLEVIEEINARFPGNPDYLMAQATALIATSETLSSRSLDPRDSNHELCRANSRKGIQIAEEQLRKFPDRYRYLRQVIQGWTVTTRSFYYESRFDDAHSAIVNAINAARQLLEKEPDDPTSHLLLGEALLCRAMIAAHQYRDQDAKEYFRESIEILKNGKNRFPEYKAFQTNLRMNPQLFERAKQGASLGSGIADLEVAPYQDDVVADGNPQ